MSREPPFHHEALNPCISKSFKGFALIGKEDRVRSRVEPSRPRQAGGAFRDPDDGRAHPAEDSAHGCIRLRAPLVRRVRDL